MDGVISTLSRKWDHKFCKLIASDTEVTLLCESKKSTYEKLKDIIKTPKIYYSLEELEKFPVFIKPDKGYGSRGTKLVNNIDEANLHMEEIHNGIICEYLPGKEYTIDCFTNKEDNLLFAGPRPRNRTKMGITVQTKSIESDLRHEFYKIAFKINQLISFKGAWFFQIKRDSEGQLTLLEIASRLGGSSSLYRYKGINFALLSIYDALGYDVKIIENIENIEISRALNVKMKFHFRFQHIYVDFDDCLIINGKINTNLIGHLYHFQNKGKSIYLITKHEKDIIESLDSFKISPAIFDSIIHLEKHQEKSDFIKYTDAIFIDDSFSERAKVQLYAKIPVFAPDMVNFL